METWTCFLGAKGGEFRHVYFQATLITIVGSSQNYFVKSQLQFSRFEALC
jgi:hypothetical protein